MKDVEIKKNTVVPGRFLTLRQYDVRYRRYDGEMSAVIEREVMETPYAATGILLYDPQCHKVAITEQFRPGMLGQAPRPWVLEIVMGMIDKPEQGAEKTAVREAMEEAGATVKRVVKIAEYYNSPGTSSEHITLFCGEVDMSTIGGVHGLANEHEDIKVCVFDLDEVSEMMDSGKINTGSTLIALQWLLARRESLWR